MTERDITADVETDDFTDELSDEALDRAEGGGKAYSVTTGWVGGNTSGG